MNKLIPFQAANFTDIAYAINEKNGRSAQEFKAHTSYPILLNDFDIKYGSDADALTAKTGLIIKSTSNFGFLAFGKNQHKNNLRTLPNAIPKHPLSVKLRACYQKRAPNLIKYRPSVIYPPGRLN